MSGPPLSRQHTLQSRCVVTSVKDMLPLGSGMMSNVFAHCHQEAQRFYISRGRECESAMVGILLHAWPGPKGLARSYLSTVCRGVSTIPATLRTIAYGEGGGVQWFSRVHDGVLHAHARYAMNI